LVNAELPARKSRKDAQKQSAGFLTGRKTMGFRIRVALYGLVAAAALVCVASPAQAQVKETVLYAFSGGSDGGFPTSTLIADGTGGFMERPKTAAPVLLFAFLTRVAALSSS
jgi:hypothetical protein